MGFVLAAPKSFPVKAANAPRAEYVTAIPIT